MGEVDVVVHAPVYEGFGLVVLEAMAAGRPVVASDAPGGVPDMVVDGETGVLVADGSPRGLAAGARAAARRRGRTTSIGGQRAPAVRGALHRPADGGPDRAVLRAGARAACGTPARRTDGARSTVHRVTADRTVGVRSPTGRPGSSRRPCGRRRRPATPSPELASPSSPPAPRPPTAAGRPRQGRRHRPPAR